VEHPEVVARRIEDAVASVGDRERVIASTDCGFCTFTRREWVIVPVVWLMLKSIREGADITSAPLCSKKSEANVPRTSAASVEGRRACHRAGHFGPDPLAATSG